jgi:hypothetical protein
MKVKSHDTSDTIEKEFNTEAAATKFKDEHADKFGGDYDAVWNDLVIEAKDSTNEEAKTVAKTLEGLFGTYNTWEQNS